MTVSYASNRVTIGNYKNGTTASDSTTTLLVTSGDILAGDIGRYVMVRPSALSSDQTQVRRITSVSGGTIGINSPWVGTIPSGTVWRVSHNCEDVHALADPNLEKIGDSSYRWNADWSISADGFFADADIALEMVRGGSPAWPMAGGGVVQFGTLWGGENNGSTETTNGCRIRFRGTTSSQSVYSGTDSRAENGGVVNYYGCLIESVTGSWMFQRMRGPTRFIGCVFDGEIGGRYYHEASEWAFCRMSGNEDITPAWSIGVTFTRPIESVVFFQNLCAMKSHQSFGGTLRNCTFADSNDDIFLVAGTTSSILDFIDSTEFDDSKIIDNGSGTLNQYRSINIVTTDSSGTSLSGVTVRVNDKDDTTQGSVQTSDGSGVVAEILALRRKWTNANPSVLFDPFRIRLRAYGYLWASLQAAVADPIKQSYAMLANGNVVQASGTASAHTGITLTDHGGSPVSWNGKNWGITITCDTSVNPGLTLADLKHYLHWHLAQTASFNGKASGLDWHNLIPMSGTETENGTYGSTTKGVRVVDQSGNPFPGVTRMQADDGTYYVPPVTYTLTLTGLIAGSEIRAYTGTDPATAIEISAIESSGTSYVINHTSGGVDGFIVIRNTGYKFLKIPITYASANVSQSVSQQVDPWYSNP